MYLHKTLQDISINGYSKYQELEDNKWYKAFGSLYILEKIFFQSKVDIQDFYKMCTLISYKTSNTQSEVEKMPYYVFNNFITFLKEIIEEENKESGSNDSKSSADTMMQDSKRMLNSQMSTAKSMIKK